MPKRPVEVGTFETLAEIQAMRVLYPEPVLGELRAADQPILRDRMKAVTASQEKGELGLHYLFTNTGVHNAPVMVQPAAVARGPEERVIPYFDRASIWNNTSGTELAIYGLGIATTRADRTPVFHVPETGMQSVVLVDPVEYDIASVGTSPITPLFNVYPDGMVHARLHDEPTPAEFVLFHDILGTFEKAAGLAEA